MRPAFRQARVTGPRQLPTDHDYAARPANIRLLTVTRLESVFEICDSQSANKLVGPCMAGSGL